jgi:hypothetical protein
MCKVNTIKISTPHEKQTKPITAEQKFGELPVYMKNSGYRRIP